MNPPITAEALLANLKVLPPERLGQIADFVDFLTTQEQRRQTGEELRAMWSAPCTWTTMSTLNCSSS